MQDVCHQPYRIEVVLHQNYVDRVACLAHHSWYPATKLVPPFLGRFVSNSLQRISREGRRTSHSLGLPRSWFSRDGLDWWSVSRMQLLADSWISWWKVLNLKIINSPRRKLSAFGLRYVGYSQDSMTAAEFDITDVLKQSKPAENGGFCHCF